MVTKGMDNLWPKVENIVSKGEIARFDQIFLSPCFQKAVASESVYMRHFVASATDAFWKYFGKKKKLLKKNIVSFKDFPYFCKEVYKSVCEKGLKVQISCFLG